MLLLALGTLGKILALAGGAGFAAGVYAANRLLSAAAAAQAQAEAEASIEERNSEV